MAPKQPDTIAQTLLALQNLYETYAAPALPPPVNTMASTLFSSALTVQPYASTMLTQSSTLMTNLLTGNSNSDGSSGNGLVSTIVLVVTLYLSFKIMNYVRRTIIGWVFLAIKIVVVMVMIQVALYAYANGMEKTMQDASWTFSALWRVAEMALGQDTSKSSTSKGTTWKNNGWGRDQVPIGKKGWL